MIVASARIAALALSIASIASAQERSVPALPADLMPTAVAETPRSRAIAEAFGQYVCADTASRLRVLPYQQQALNDESIPWMPDLLPGVLGTFLVTVARECTAMQVPDKDRTVISWIGMRDSGLTADSARILWQVTLPRHGTQWTVEMRSAFAVFSRDRWYITRETLVRRDTFQGS